ncbi:hypothetical protein B0H11DRAFT_2263213 [Mycena galericulata]|nr:hypothetical protein B0H11DRAFT_2263213 [Mycena galericulata]
MSSTSVREMSLPSVKNVPLVGLAERNAQFSDSNQLAPLVLIVPYIVKSLLPSIPMTVAYWTLMSTYGARKNDKVLPGKDIEGYITIKDPELKKLYNGKNKIPMHVFHDTYFEGKFYFNATLGHAVMQPV